MPEKAKIIIDMRENSHYGELLSRHEIECERKQLSVGDFILSEKLVAERKSRSDFEASIIDGRLLEQASRLSTSYERAVIIVEGEAGEGRDGRVDRRALLGAYSSLVSDFGISLFFTKNPHGTAEILSAMAKHEQIAKKQLLRVNAKPKSLTIEQFQLSIIESLPKIGPKMARKLLDHFGSPANILSADEDKLSKVEGFGKKRAKLIRRVLDSVYKSQDE